MEGIHVVNGSECFALEVSLQLELSTENACLVYLLDRIDRIYWIFCAALFPFAGWSDVPGCPASDV
jgi:hypothetical protein